MLDTTLKIATLTDTIIGIIIAIQNMRIPEKNLLSPSLFLCILVFIVLILLFVIRSDNSKKYSLIKFISYWFRRGSENYYVREREMIYNYHSLTSFTYEKKMVLVSRGSFKNYTGRWRWSKPQKIDEFDKECTCSTGQRGLVQWGQRESWYTYTVNFDPLPKGSEQTVTLKLKKLDNSDNLAQPYLKADIIEHTERLSFKIQLPKDLTFDFDKLRLTVYHESSQNPFLLETFHRNQHKLFVYDERNNIMTVSIDHPIYGYNYVFDFPGLKPAKVETLA